MSPGCAETGVLPPGGSSWGPQPSVRQEAQCPAGTSSWGSRAEPSPRWCPPFCPEAGPGRLVHISGQRLTHQHFYRQEQLWAGAVAVAVSWSGTSLPLQPSRTPPVNGVDDGGPLPGVVSEQSRHPIFMSGGAWPCGPRLLAFQHQLAGAQVTSVRPGQYPGLFWKYQRPPRTEAWNFHAGGWVGLCAQLSTQCPPHLSCCNR